ncbi:MAG: metallophosphoesterase family protein, partial [Firmicutes bacterium]|nr:metallophosphoesterase family protein [Bacillota bacterium]
MKILILADVESIYIWDFFNPDYFKDIDLILSCGDLQANYLSFLATLTHPPIVYVPGNHDKKYLTEPPEGCICADDRLVVVNGLRIVGLGGSMMYNKGPYQYTQAQMKQRAAMLRLPIAMHKGFDILLTHAPAYGIGDADDLPHVGFKAFNNLIHRYHPKLMAHGHVHLNYG